VTENTDAPRRPPKTTAGRAMGSLAPRRARAAFEKIVVEIEDEARNTVLNEIEQQVKAGSEGHELEIILRIIEKMRASS
jgi:hypothetical protein